MNSDSSIIKFDPKYINYNIAQEGRRIYNTNVFMRSLTNLMENPEFSDMFDNYFDSWDNIELFVMFAKVYQSITKQFSNMTGYEKIALVKKIMDTSKTRQLVCNEIRNFRNLKTLT